MAKQPDDKGKGAKDTKKIEAALGDSGKKIAELERAVGQLSKLQAQAERKPDDAAKIVEQMSDLLKTIAKTADGASRSTLAAAKG